MLNLLDSKISPYTVRHRHSSLLKCVLHSAYMYKFTQITHMQSNHMRFPVFREHTAKTQNPNITTNRRCSPKNL